MNTNNKARLTAGFLQGYMMANNPHGDFRRNQKVIVFMKDGSKFIDRYIERKSSRIKLKSAGFVSFDKIRQISIFRQP